MSKWSNALRSKFYEFKANHKEMKPQYTKLSEFLIKEYIWREPYNETYEKWCTGRKYDGDCMIFISMTDEVISVSCDRIEYYTENNNDCLLIRVNKHYSRILCLDYIEDMRFESACDDDCGLGHIMS